MIGCNLQDPKYAGNIRNPYTAVTVTDNGYIKSTKCGFNGVKIIY